MLSSVVSGTLHSSKKLLGHEVANGIRNGYARRLVHVKSFSNAESEDENKRPRKMRHISTLQSDRIRFQWIANLRIGPDSPDNPSLNLIPGFNLNRMNQMSRNLFGELYLHKRKERPTVASELRFRVTHSPKGTEFSLKFDFRMPNRIPWSLPIWQIVKDPQLAPIKEQLLKDQIVTPEFIEHCDRLFPQEFMSVRPKNVIHRLRQPFPVHVAKNKISLWVVGEDKVVDIHIGASFMGYPTVRQTRYEGNAMAEIDYDKEQGVYVCRVVQPPKSRVREALQYLKAGREKPLRCYSYSVDDPIPVLKEILGM